MIDRFSSLMPFGSYWFYVGSIYDSIIAVFLNHGALQMKFF